MRSASSGYSDLSYTYSGGEISGIMETYQNDRYVSIPEVLSKYYNYERFTTLARYMPGGREVIRRYEAYQRSAERGNAILYSGSFSIVMEQNNLLP